MQTARELDIMQVELDKKMELFLEEFVRGHLGDRMGGTNGTEIHMENGRRPGRDSGAVQYDQERDIIR